MGFNPKATIATPPEDQIDPEKSPIAHKQERASPPAIRPAARTSGALPTKMSICHCTKPPFRGEKPRAISRWPNDSHLMTGFVSPNQQTAPEPRTSQTLRQPFRSKRRDPHLRRGVLRATDGARKSAIWDRNGRARSPLSTTEADRTGGIARDALDNAEDASFVGRRGRAHRSLSPKRRIHRP